MCGITGVYSYGWTQDVHEELIRRMRDRMVHRGPDDAGTWVSADGRIGLGHRRLSIVDLSRAGRQPMANEDGRVRIVFNGEIYNHTELRSDLEARGHVYRSRTDTETLVHLYEEYGFGMLERLRGMFAFAIWDARREQLFLARDRIGIKPLYYHHHAGRLIFGSEIKALLEHDALSADVDLDAVYHYLTYYTAPAPTTLFEGIRKLPAGHAMVVDRTGGNRSWRWWDPASIPAPPAEETGSVAAAAGKVRSLLEDSVQERLMADVPYGVMLSGGLDSSAIAALVQQGHSGPVRTFSVGYRNAPAHDETRHARYMADHLGTDHHEILIDQDDLVSYLPELVYAQDEPLADWVCVPLYYVSKLVRDSGTIVSLVGEGSDEQFAGYDHYRRYVRLAHGPWRWYNHVPTSLRRGVHRVLDPVLRLMSVPREVRELVRRAGAGEPLFLSGAVAAWETDKRDLISRHMAEGGWRHLSSVPVASGAARALAEHRPASQFLDALIYQEFQLRLPELLLMRVDKITMSTSIEARVPFLDHRLVEFSSWIPGDMKIRDGRTKHVLKESVKDLLPDHVIDRRKQGFSAPVKEWFRGELAGWARRSILDSSLRDRDLFDYSVLSRMIEEHRSGRRNYDTLLWSLVNLSQWYDHWIAREPERAMAAR